MVEQPKKQPNRVKDWAFKVAKATIKATLIYALYFILSPYLAPVAPLVPGLIESIELFVTVTVLLIILGDLAADTIYQCFLDAGRNLFLIAFLVFALSDGVLSLSLESYSLTVNLTAVYAILALLGVLGLAKSVLSAINFMSQRAETGVKP
jgi:hypothetical protein